MKKSKKLLAFLMGLTMVIASVFGGCGGETPTVSMDGAPDYSQSTEEFYRWGFSMVRDDWVMLNGEKYYSEESFQTEEMTKQLADVGFNMVFMDWSFADCSFKKGHSESFIRVVRDCEKYGLKTVWSGAEFHSLSSREESIIQPYKWAELIDEHTEDCRREIVKELEEQNYVRHLFAQTKALNPTLTEEEIDVVVEEKYNAKVDALLDSRLEEYIFMNESSIYFKDQDQVNRYCAMLLDGVKEEYPSFVGVTLMDEPNYRMFQAIKEVVIGLQAADPEIYIMLNLLPMSTNPSIHTSYCEGGRDLGMTEAYKGYLENYHAAFNGLLDFIMYDDYPICVDGLLSSYMQCQQMVSNFCRDNGYERRIVMQTYDVGNRRVPELPDMLFQANVAMAFGVNDLSVYQYLPSANSNGNTFPNENNYVLKYDGSRNPLYYALQETWDEVEYMDNYLAHFKYKGMMFERTDMTGPSGWNYTMGLESDELTKLSGYEFRMLTEMGGLFLVTEMYDEENDQWGYYVINGTDPGVSSEMRVTLTFNDYNCAQVVQSMNTQNVVLNEHKITLELGSGRGAFVMPF